MTEAKRNYAIEYKFTFGRKPSKKELSHYILISGNRVEYQNPEQ